MRTGRIGRSAPILGPRLGEGMIPRRHSVVDDSGIRLGGGHVSLTGQILSIVRTVTEISVVPTTYHG